jgi:aquaporin Z
MVVQFHEYRRKKPRHSDKDELKVPRWSPLLAEFIGTLIFTLVTAGGILVSDATGQLNGVEQYAPRGLIIIALIYAFGAASGAHFNPAVTFAFALRKAFPWKEVPRYWLVQILGAIAGAYIISIAFGGAPVWMPLKPAVSTLQATFFEIFFSFTLITVVLSASRQNKLIGHNAAFAVGATLLVIGMLAGPISGGVVNPAKALGQAVASANMTDVLLFVIAPFVGATLAVWLTNALHGSANAREAEAALGRHILEGRAGDRHVENQ